MRETPHSAVHREPQPALFMTSRFVLPESLNAALRAASPFALAFSGGLDSRFLAHAALLCGARIVLYHIRGPHVPEAESEEAERWAKERGLPYRALHLDPLSIPAVRSGSRERCYGCKRLLFHNLAEVTAEDGFAVLCDGSNASDLSAYRPGIRALRELGVRSPLTDAGLDKDAIRRLAAATGLDRPDQKARPCLLTRYAYGLSPDARSLAALAVAEADIGAALEEALGRGELDAPPDFRLRLVGAEPANAHPFAVELHLGSAIPARLAAVLAGRVEAAGFAAPALAVLDSVSGHYDKVKS